MSAYIKPILSNAWKAISWVMISKTRNNRLFWVVFMGLFTLINTIKIDGWIDTSLLVLTASIFGFGWSAWWYHVDEEDNGGSWYKESDIDTLMFERDEALEDVGALHIQIQVLTEELEKYRD